MIYTEYLKTEHWQKKRQEVIEFWGKRCMICDSQDTLNVHHRTYKNLGNESILDLVVLCSDCHALFHDRLNRNVDNSDSLSDMLWTMKIPPNTDDLADYERAKNRWSTLCLCRSEYETGIKQIADWIGI